MQRQAHFRFTIGAAENDLDVRVSGLQSLRQRQRRQVLLKRRGESNNVIFFPWNPFDAFIQVSRNIIPDGKKSHRHFRREEPAVLAQQNVAYIDFRGRPVVPVKYIRTEKPLSDEGGRRGYFSDRAIISKSDARGESKIQIVNIAADTRRPEAGNQQARPHRRKRGRGKGHAHKCDADVPLGGQNTLARCRRFPQQRADRNRPWVQIQMASNLAADCLIFRSEALPPMLIALLAPLIPDAWDAVSLTPISCAAASGRATSFARKALSRRRLAQ